MTDTDTKTPLLQVISGNATPEEVAAILALLAAAGATGVPAGPPPSRWSGRASGGWKGSGLPAS